MHTLSNLFAQLGLPGDRDAIDAFIAAHRPLPDALRLHEAPFWTPSQAGFLRESILDDADWSDVIDSLDTELRATPRVAKAAP